jgi:tripartite-type tricarboxylate transporter receptor subunit TctC
MQFKRKMTLFASAAVAVLAVAWMTPAQAAYPDRPITFVCWSSAGSPMDTMIRKLASLVEKDLGQPIAVENRKGGSGAVAMSYVMSQPADGYTVVSTSSSMTFTMAKGKIPFTPDDFIVLRATQAEPSSLAVRKDSPLKTMKDFVDTLKAKPNSLKVGGYASAGFHQFVFYQIVKATGVKAAWIPFDGGNKAALAVLGGHLDVAVMTPSSALSQVKSGELRLLGVSTEARDPYLPDVPTMKEQGYDVVASIWRGVMVKKGTPKPVIDTLIAAIKKAEASKAWKDFQVQRQQTSVNLSVDQLAAQVRKELTDRREFLEQGGFLKKKK